MTTSNNPTVDVGGLKEFKLHVDRWSTYVSRLKAWFDIQSIKPTEYSKFLVAVVGTEPLDLIIDLCYPEEPEKVSFEKIVALVEEHLTPKRSLIAERMVFRSCKQAEGQSITDYLVQLKKLSKACKFASNDILKENLRDQFVFGVTNERIQQRLLIEDDKLTLSRATELALSLEAAVRDSTPTQSRGEAGEVFGVNAARGRGGGGWRGGRGTADRGEARARRGSLRYGFNEGGVGGAGGSRADGNRSACFRCDGRHRSEKCSFINSACYVCGKKGHIAKMCQFRKQRVVHRVSDLDEDDASSASSKSVESTDRALNIYQLSDKESADRRWNIDVKINTIPITMEGDTGAAVSVISYRTYKNNFSHCKLFPYASDLKMYCGQRVKPRGEFICSVNINGRSVDGLRLIVVNNESSPSLLGRNWMRSFGIGFPSIPSVFNVNCENFNSTKLKNELMKRFPNVFKAGVGTFNKANIKLEVRADAVPVWRRARPVPHALRPAVDAELARLQREGIISPVDWSDWGTPVVPVLKKNGEVRLCGDFKTTLNPVLVDDKYPIPRIEDIFASLQGGNFFSKIDLSQAYLQCVLDEPSRKLCTIVTLHGMFCYNRLPFGIKCAPNKFQRMMEKLFRLPFVTCYLDDLNVSGSGGFADHWQRLIKVFEILSESGLRVAPEKCSFFQKSISYLGHVIDSEGLHTETAKVDAINNTPVPNNVRELKAYLGLVNYYGKFVPDLSNSISPLYDLLKKENKFYWSPACDAAFKGVKKALLNAPVLAHFDPALATSVTCDASPHGVAAVLTQRGADGVERPVLHASRTLSTAEKNYAQICREGLAIVFGITKFHDYIYGREFQLVTDCKPLASILSENKGVPLMAANRLQRWAVILGAYNYRIKCIGSEHNCVADSLSRIPVIENVEHSCVDSYLNFVEKYTPLNHKDIAKSTSSDASLQRVMRAIKTNWQYCNSVDIKPYFELKQYLSIEQGCILFGHRVVIPSSLRHKILKQIHETHQGIVKCKNLARNYVYWPNIDADIERECRACETCARERAAPPAATLHPWVWPQEPWFRLHVDFFTLSGNTIYYFVVIDSHSKWIEAFRVPGTSAQATISKLRNLFGRFGLPREIVSDNGPPFNGFEFRDYLSNVGIQHITVTPYKPSSNGAAENAVKIVKTCLKKAMRDKIELGKALEDFLFIYRSTPHSVTGKTPVNLLLGRNVRTPFDLLRPSVGDTVRRKQSKQIEYKGGVERHFKINDTVFFKLFRNNKYYWEKGIVTDRIGPLTYMITHDGKLFKKHIDQVRRDETIHNKTGDRIPFSGHNASGSFTGDSNSGRPERPRSEPNSGGGLVIEPELTTQPMSPSSPRNGSPSHTEPIIPGRSRRIRKPVVRYGFEFD